MLSGLRQLCIVAPSNSFAALCRRGAPCRGSAVINSDCSSDAHAGEFGWLGHPKSGVSSISVHQKSTISCGDELQCYFGLDHGGTCRKCGSDISSTSLKEFPAIKISREARAALFNSTMRTSKIISRRTVNYLHHDKVYIALPLSPDAW